MKKTIVIFLVFSAAALFANDYKWDLVNALIACDYPAAERLINQNINRVSADEKRLIANFAVTYPQGETTLMVLSLLSRHNVRPSSFDLYTAISRYQSDETVQFIINSGVSANGEILLLAMEKQRYNIAFQFITSGCDVNYQYPLSSSYSDGMSPLMYASKAADFELVQLLVNRGANINARNKDGNTALSIAQMNGSAQISDFLIERGAAQTAYDPIPVQPQSQTSSGIASLLNSQSAAFQTGTYRLSSGERNLTFTGNSNYGNISFISGSRIYTGAYQSSGNALTLVMEGRSFVYKIDSGVSFSGNGETWIRIGS
ncbi:MAG: ankyrin repeat domain-containing protein [Treponema sp.]|nr:ankyrin repeat domain-containing protein [Treponema sp.]